MALFSFLHSFLFVCKFSETFDYAGSLVPASQRANNRTSQYAGAEQYVGRRRRCPRRARPGCGFSRGATFSRPVGTRLPHGRAIMSQLHPFLLLPAPFIVQPLRSRVFLSPASEEGRRTIRARLPGQLAPVRYPFAAPSPFPSASASASGGI